MWDGTTTQQIGTASRATPAFKVTGLAQGTVYYFYVQAFNNTNIANSAWVNAKTLAQGITPPANFKAQVINANTIGLSWNDVGSETGYRVYRWTGVAGESPVVIATLAANTTGYQAIGLLPGRAYSFYIQAFNATNFANTAWVTVNTPAVAPLQAPGSVAVAVTGTNSVRVSWTEPARATGYNVYIWNGFGWTNIATVSRGTTSVPINGLAAYRTYWFLVQSFTDGFAEVANSGYVFANL
jgi:titin